MTTNKSPVYHRTSDGRKVVIVEEFANNMGFIVCDVKSLEVWNVNYDELTPWVELVVRYLAIYKDKNGLVYDSPKKIEMYEQYDGRIGIAKFTITGNDFTVEKCDE